MKTVAMRGARAALALAVMLAIAGCETPPRSEPDTPAWRADCAPVTRPAALSLDAARDAHRAAERRHAARLREAASPGSFLREMAAALAPERVAAGELCPMELADRGELLFEHEFGFADGLGGGSARESLRPFRRVHAGLFGGPETNSCPSCHWIGGPNGAGAETDNAFLFGDGRRPASGDARNPPALVALGVVQALAREMSEELAARRDALAREAVRTGGDAEVRLAAKGVDFGVLRAGADGAIDASAVRGVDADLIVKPFGWKGSVATFEEFAAEALQVHIGIQSEPFVRTAAREVIGTGSDPGDPDADGVHTELGAGSFAALNVHMALLELPIVRPLIQDYPIDPAATGLLAPTTTSFADDFQRGRRHFHEIGCADCHRPMMVLHDPVVEIEGVPPIDLAREMRRPALAYDADLGGYPVWLFSDLKRHDMGPDNAALHVQSGVERAEYITPRLWAVADSAPYLHDGRAPSFDYAIAGHGGEGAAARSAFDALDRDAKGALRVYLMSLRRSPRVIVP